MRTQCEECEYLKYCFWALRWKQMYLSDSKCRQGRKAKQEKKPKDKVVADES